MSEVRTQVMLPEYYPHDCTWTAWPSSHPHSRRLWKVPGISKVQDNMKNLIRAIAQFEVVRVLVEDESDVVEVETKILQEPLPRYEVVFHVCETDHNIWMRDIGPTFCLSQNRTSLRSVCWVFNSWGKKFSPWDKAAEVGLFVSSVVNADVYKSTLTIEGGSIHNDGEGTIIVTESSVINDNRNPGWTKQRMEDELRTALDVEVCLSFECVKCISECIKFITIYMHKN